MHTVVAKYQKYLILTRVKTDKIRFYNRLNDTNYIRILYTRIEFVFFLKITIY